MHNGRGAGTPVTLAYGIIAFPQSGPLPSTSPSSRRHEFDPVTSVTALEV